MTNDLKRSSDKVAIRTSIVASRGRGENWEQSLEERDDGVTNALTTVGKDNMVKIKSATARGFEEVMEGGVVNIQRPTSDTRRGRVVDGGATAPTLDTGGDVGVVTIDGEEVRIRRLTPRECFRLQGFPDELFDKAAQVCSDAQLYKQAGNAVTVNVVYEIAKRLRLEDNNDSENDDVEGYEWKDGLDEGSDLGGEGEGNPLHRHG